MATAALYARLMPETAGFAQGIAQEQLKVETGVGWTKTDTPQKGLLSNFCTNRRRLVQPIIEVQGDC